MVQPEIIIDTSGAEARLTGIKNGARRAVSGAINDVMASGRTKLARGATAQVNLKYGRVLKQIQVKRATPDNLAASVRVNDKARPGLMAFGAKQTTRGVTYRIKKNGKRNRIDSAFVARGGRPRTPGLMAAEDSGVLRVYRRRGKRRYPLIDLKGPSLNRVIKTNDIDDVTSREMRTMLPQRVDARVGVLIERGR